MIRGILTVLFVIICIFLSAVILLQEGKSAGLSGSIGGEVYLFQRGSPFYRFLYDEDYSGNRRIYPTRNVGKISES